jgi:hypothetical protein
MRIEKEPGGKVTGPCLDSLYRKEDNIQANGRRGSDLIKHSLNNGHMLQGTRLGVEC